MSDIQDDICAVFLCIVSATGIVFNTISVLVRNTVFRNAFGMLTTLHTMANIGVLSIFLCGKSTKYHVQRLSLHTGTKQSVREARFFFQAVINSLVYCLMLISFDVIAPWTSHPVALFFFTTGTWAIGHTCGGLILALFNREIRRLFVHPKHFVTWIFDSRSANSIPNNATNPSPHCNVSTF